MGSFDRSERCFDVTHPRQITDGSFLVSALGYSLGQHGHRIVDSELRSIIDGEVFGDMASTGVKVPNLHLMRDLSQAGDMLGSFLALDRSGLFQPVLGDDAHLLSFDWARSYAIHSIDRLLQGEHQESWVNLHLILDGLPPYDDLREKLSALILKTDFAAFFERQPDLGVIVLRAACQQALHLKDEQVCSWLEKNLFEVTNCASDLSILEKAKNGFGTSVLIVETALELAIASSKDQENAVMKFAELGELVLDASPQMRSALEATIPRMWQHLPLSQARHLSRLLVRLRAD